MSTIDWLIVILPLCFVMGMGLYSRRYIKGVSDFLVAGRVCGRYVLKLGDVANALSIIGLIAFLEIHYSSGFATAFWSRLLIPLTVVLGLVGFCTYRFRETNSMSLGQFLEMRYSRKFRIFAAALRSAAEITANMIFPALAARFFMQMLELPQKLNILGLSIPTYDFLIVLFLTMAISLICMGGTLALVITDTIQGLVLYPLMAMFAIYILCKFSWSGEVIPVVQDRVAGESFLNPYDIYKLKHFNFFSLVIVAVFNTIMHRASWIGAGSSGAAKNPHEQKMAGLLGTWSNMMVSVFYLLVAVCIITFMTHKNYAKQANEVRQSLAQKVVKNVVKDSVTLDTVSRAIKEIRPIEHTIGTDKPLSQKDNLDTQFLAHVHKSLLEDAAARAPKDEKAQIDAAGKANDLFQQCRTLFTQMSISETMRHLLPKGMFGAFCLLLMLAMLSTDDSQIFSATLTVAQDVVLPLKKGGFTPQAHIRMIRIVAIVIGCIFAVGSHYMSQMDYIRMYVVLACTIWLSGCGPVMVFGLYWKKGTTAAAWASQLSGMIISIIYIIVQRNWANVYYPLIAKAHLVDFCDKLLTILSKPFGSFIVWRMDAVRCPVNSFEFNFFLMVFTLLLYVVVSLLTCKKPFNMDRMLHRGAYNLDGKKDLKVDWTPRGICRALLGITPQYTRGDRILAYSIFFHSFIYTFIFAFLGVIIWNTFSRWSINYWSWYFAITMLIVPGVIAIFTTIWFGIGGTRDLIRMFHDLEGRIANPLDDGRVEGEMSLYEKEQFEKITAREEGKNNQAAAKDKE